MNSHNGFLMQSRWLWLQLQKKIHQLIQFNFFVTFLQKLNRLGWLSETVSREKAERNCCWKKRWLLPVKFRSKVEIRVARGRFGRRVIRSSSGDTLESVRCWHASSSEKQQKLGCFLNQKYFLLSLKCPSFYSFCEEEEECYQSVTQWADNTS
jgi:hypothetical protein